MTDTQPEALRLAGLLELAPEDGVEPQTAEDAAAELRRLHAELETLRAGYDAAPSAAVASKAVRAAIRAANMQLVRTGDDEFMLVTLKQVTPQADTQPSPASQPVACEPLIRQLVAALEGYRRNHNDTQPCDAERAGRAWLEAKK